MHQFVGYAKKTVQFIVLALVAVYVVNILWYWGFLGYYGESARYVNRLGWAALAYWLISKFEINWRFLWQEGKVWLPVFIAMAVLTLVHGMAVYPHFETLRKLLTILLAIGCLAGSALLSLNAFFLINGVACILLAGSGSWQVFGMGYAFPGEVINQNIFAMGTVLLGSVALGAVFCRQRLSRATLFFSLACAVPAYSIVILTNCRITFLAELAVLCLYLWLLVREKLCSGKQVMMLAVAVVVSVAAVLYVDSTLLAKFSLISEQTEHFAELEKGETTGSSIGLRLAMWQVAFQQVVPHFPVFGIGHAAKVDLPSLINTMAIAADFHPQHWHNEVVNVLCEGGIFYFLAWVMTALALLRRAWHEPVLLMMLVPVAVCGLAEVFFDTQKTFLIFMSVWLLYCGAVCKTKPLSLREVFQAKKQGKS